MIIAIDWSHTKNLTTFDGSKVRVEDKKTLLKRIGKIKDGEESNDWPKSSRSAHSPSLVVEQSCPMSFIYTFCQNGHPVLLIDNNTTQRYREKTGIEKTDENDAKIIWKLAQNGAKLEPVTVDDTIIQIHDKYHQYCRFQKARVAMTLMKKSHQRQYGKSKELVEEESTTIDLSPYDIAIDTLQSKEKILLKSLESSIKKNGLISEKDTLFFKPPEIRGLGKRIWIGLLVTADPRNFKCLSAYMRFCGLTDEVTKSHKYNRHAKMLYHLLSEGILKAKDEKFRAVYDKCKEDITEKHSDYTKLHIHNASLNRTATFLAKEIFKYCRVGI